MLQQIIGASLSEPHIDEIARVFIVGGSSSLILRHDKYGSLIYQWYSREHSHV